MLLTQVLKFVAIPSWNNTLCTDCYWCFLFSYEKREMEEFVVHLLVLSHVYLVPQLKQECEKKLEHGLLTKENVVDIFQLALLCDAPRLSLICHRMILKNFKTVCTTTGWKVMKKSHPALEKELVESMIEEDNVRDLIGFFFCFLYLYVAPWKVMLKFIHV